MMQPSWLQSARPGVPLLSMKAGAAAVFQRKFARVLSNRRSGSSTRPSAAFAVKRYRYPIRVTSSRLQSRRRQKSSQRQKWLSGEHEGEAMAEFRMPSLGSDMEAGTLVEWLVKPGDSVKHGDIIAVVETQKGAIEIEIFETGEVEQFLVDIGTKVPVGTPLAKIRTEQEVKAAAATIFAGCGIAACSRWRG